MEGNQRAGRTNLSASLAEFEVSTPSNASAVYRKRSNFPSMRGYLCVCLALIVLLKDRGMVMYSDAQITQLFEPVWHTTNDYAKDGSTCAALRPTVTRTCPVFGVRGLGKSLQQIEAQCAQYGFVCEADTHLMMDGSCKRCEEGFFLVEGENSVHCQNADGVKMFNELVNPFDCVAPGKEPRTLVGAYRPCHSVENAPVAAVPQYYKGLDLSLESTMSACAQTRGLNHHITSVSQLLGFQTYDFPVIRVSDDSHGELGYLQCENASPTPYNYFGIGWSICYGLLIACVAFILGYCFITRSYEKQMKKKDVGLYHSKSSLFERALTGSLTMPNVGIMMTPTDTRANMHDKTMVELGGMKQIGYRRTLWGEICYSAFVCVTILLNLVLLVIIFDVYGITYFAFCKGQPDVVAACEAAMASGDEPNFREGLRCASGCLFGWDGTSGSYTMWPFQAQSGGGPRVYVFFISFWHFTTAWMVFMKAFKTKIRSFCAKRCSLKFADMVNCSKPAEKEIVIEKDKKSMVESTIRFFDGLMTRVMGERRVYELCKVLYDPLTQCRYFTFQNTRYIYNPSTDAFASLPVVVATTQRGFYLQSSYGLTTSEATERMQQVGKNAIDVKIPNFFVALGEELFDYFYFYQVYCLLAWIAFIYWTMGVLITVMVMISAVVKVVYRIAALKDVRRMTHIDCEVSVYRDKQWIVISSEELVPGDVISVTRGMVVVADLVLTKGRCVCNESSLTGEPTPVAKIPVTQMDTPFSNTPANTKYMVFSGTTIESVSHDSTELGGKTATFAVVYSTNVFTDRGKLVKNILYPAPLSFKLDQHWKLVFTVLLIWGLIAFFVCIYFINGLLTSWFYGVMTISQILSPLIPAAFVAGQSQAIYRLRKNNIFCVDGHRVTVAGKVKIFCFDKTGTLTTQGLQYQGVMGVTHTHRMERNLHSTVTDEMIRWMMATCHELDISVAEEGKQIVIGNEVDKEMFSNSSFMISPSSSSLPTLRYLGTTLQVLRRFEFDRESMSMSVVVQDLKTGKLHIFVKGSAEALEKRCSSPSDIPHGYREESESLARKGCYVLGIAHRPFEGKLSDLPSMKREDIESNISLLGLLAFKNCLRPETTDVIDELKRAAIRPVMITGDNALTAMRVARDCNLCTAKQLLMSVVEGDRLYWKDCDSGVVYSSLEGLYESLELSETELVITPPALRFVSATDNEEDSSRNLLRYSRIFARMKPDHKVEVVGLHMAQAVTGMCGDGANDARALRAAHCGVALAGGASEASMVAPFSSPLDSLKIIPNILKDGRCSLSVSVAVYKYLVVVGEISVVVSFLQYYFGIVCAEIYWITWDGLLSIGMCWCLLQAKPAKVLTPSRPTSSLLGSETVLSICFPVFWNTLILVLAMVYLHTQDWFLCHEFDANLTNITDWWLKGQNFEAAALCFVASHQYLTTPLLYNFGFDYRARWYKNYYILGYYVAGLIFYGYLGLAGINPVSCFFSINCGDAPLVERWVSLGILPSDTYIPTAYPGCACDEQVADNRLCEAEYVDCGNRQYNQSFHHNIFPDSAKYTLYAFAWVNIFLLFATEVMLVVGPMRRWLRRKSKMLKENLSVTHDKVILSERSSSSSKTFSAINSESSITSGLDSPVGGGRDVQVGDCSRGGGVVM